LKAAGTQINLYQRATAGYRCQSEQAGAERDTLKERENGRIRKRISGRQKKRNKEPLGGTYPPRTKKKKKWKSGWKEEEQGRELMDEAAL